MSSLAISTINYKKFLLLLSLLAFFVMLFTNVDASKSGERIVVTYEGKSYDLTEFKHKHPGGPKVLEAVNGKDVKEYLLGKKGVKLDHMVQHKHSKGVTTELLPMFEIKH